jgi:hypothetical protein
MIDLILIMDSIIADIIRQPLYYLTMLLAILGATWTSGGNRKMRGFGFLVWVFSNGYLGYQFYLAAVWPMVATFIYYTFCNFRGMYNAWKPEPLNTMESTV